MLGTTLPTPVYDLYRQRFSFSELTITVIFAIYATWVIAALLVFGRLSDDIGRRRALLPGLALFGAALDRLSDPGRTWTAARRPRALRSDGQHFTGTALVDLSPAGPRRRNRRCRRSARRRARVRGRRGGLV
jgi:hypothetical protein